ncbi:hypothetical protein DITRI_Ditri16bG0100700 [Diplodiscus trichospermus]
MADATIVNGEGENQTAEDFYDADEAKITELSSKIEALESENLKLSNENKEEKEKIKKLTLQLDQLRNKEEEMRLQMDQWEEDNRVLESIAARSAELETEVSRLQHDLITSMSEVEEVNKDVVEFKRGLEEKALVIERLDKEIDELKKEKVESEKKVRDLERKIGVLEVREMEERSKKVRIEEEMREKIDEFKNKVEELEAELAGTRAELERSKEEKREYEEKAMVLELNMLELKGAVEERTSEAINGKVRENLESVGCEEKGLNAPVVAAGTAGAVAVAAAVVYLCCRKPS